MKEPHYERCHILFTGDIFTDDPDGCLKPSAHNDHHVFRAADGRLMAWEDDYGCKCGCWDDWEEYGGDVCGFFWEVKSIEE
jgi:hypothetical protein